jgi:hypothetical protein
MINKKNKQEETMEKINKRKDKVFHSIWLTRAEALSLRESIKILQKESTSKEKGWAISNITEIIQSAYERGDFKE